ncbi:hypothetical protein CLU79DRAFT_732772 [Phycomyces nitens]|nr:hypothetical protein CLU79DRAFT_732772 [Phycomyces nitens]
MARTAFFHFLLGPVTRGLTIGLWRVKPLSSANMAPLVQMSISAIVSVSLYFLPQQTSTKGKECIAKDVLERNYQSKHSV